MSKSGSDLFIVDNSDTAWKVRRYLKEWCDYSQGMDVATGFFEVGGLLALDGAWQAVPNIRILMGNEVSMRTKRAFTEGLTEIKAHLDQSIESEKAKNDFLKGVPAIVKALESGQIKCRVYRKAKFHAKAYITHAEREVIGSAALVGSSNLTWPGICDNVELNVQITGTQVTALQDWYDHHWAEAEDVTPDILRVVQHHTQERSPFEVWAKALFEYARGRGPSPDQWDRETSVIFPKLAGYQRDAYKNLVEIAARYGAAFLCDGVGLGKTHVGLMIIERMIAHHGRRVVLFAPKAAREDVWEPLMEDLLPHLSSDFQPLVCYNHTDLHRKGTWPQRIARTVKDTDVVLIDEAHHFRNPGVAGTGEQAPSRYRKLQGYLNQPESRPKQVFYLTATPINNSVHDFRHILGLVTGDNQAYFSEGGRNLGIHNLRSHFNELERKFQQQAADDGLHETEYLDALRQMSESREIFGELVVQRSRGYVRASERLESASKVVFPNREVPRVASYQLKITYGRLLDSVAAAFDRKKPLFALAIYNPLSYLVTPPDEQDFEAGRQKQVVALIRTLFLKRFESSARAFELSCFRLLRRLLAWVEVHAERDHDKGRLARWKAKHAKLLDRVGHVDAVQDAFWADDDDTDEFITDDDRDAVNRLDPERYRIDDMLDDTLDDLEQVADFLGLVGDVRPERDSKLTALTRLLQRDKELAGQKVIIFTEFSDTAAYIETQLRKRKGLGRIERIDGNSSQEQRSAAVRHFAPFYNRVSSPGPNEQIDILIATDVLAEGLNLQDANRLVNFDLHWNPVRLMQRIGRVDRRRDPDIEKRLLAAHPNLEDVRETVVYWNFLPPDELETLLRLYNRVNSKALVISKTFGIEGRKLLRPEDDFDPVKEINEQFEGEQTTSERLALEYEQLAQEYPEFVERLPGYPLKTFSGKASPAADTRAVFFCFRIPRPDLETLNEKTGEPCWTESAGETVWLLLDLDGKTVAPEPARIANFVRAEPDTPRQCRFDQAALTKLREKAEKQLARTHLRPLQAPVGVAPVLKCWMEIN